MFRSHCVAAGTVLSIFLAACGTNGSSQSPVASGKGVITGCAFGADQNATFMGEQRFGSVPVAFASGQFASSEISAVTTQMDTWNAHYAAVYGFNAFNYGNSSNPNTAPAPVVSMLSNYNVLSPGETGWVSGQYYVIQKDGPGYQNSAWPYGQNVLALTTLAKVPLASGQSLQVIYNATTEINYHDFYAAGMPQANLAGTMLHEFGHLLGLGHPCEASSTVSGIPNCYESNISPDYLSAVMYPGVSLTNPVMALNTNDQSRANCLFSYLHN